MHPVALMLCAAALLLAGACDALSVNEFQFENEEVRAASMVGCTPDTCQNGGTCDKKPNGSYYCSCMDGFKGEKCESKIIGCTPNPCQNGAHCDEKPDGGYYCKCKEGFQGEKCDGKIRIVCPLEPNPYRYDSKEGVLKSPGYPQNYPTNQQCFYFIGAPDAKKITLTFEDVDVDQREDPDTYLNYGTGASRSFHSTRVKTKPASPIVLNTDRVWMMFYTGMPIQAHKGFKLHFKIE